MSFKTLGSRSTFANVAKHWRALSKKNTHTHYINCDTIVGLRFVKITDVLLKDKEKYIMYIYVENSITDKV